MQIRQNNAEFYIELYDLRRKLEKSDSWPEKWTAEINWRFVGNQTRVAVIDITLGAL